MNVTLSSLKRAVAAANSRYSRGLNDDDQVFHMVQIANKLKGYSVWNWYATYEICTDEERLTRLVDKYGYWSEEVKNFNTVLQGKGGFEYMQELNNKVKYATQS